MKATRSASLSSSATSDVCAMPAEPSLVSDLTISGKASRRGRRTALPMRKTANSGTGMRWYERSFFEMPLSRASISPRGLQPV